MQVSLHGNTTEHEFNEVKSALENCIISYDKLSRKLQKVFSNLIDIADDLDNLNKTVTSAKIAGRSTVMMGTIAAIVGLVVSPITLGAASILAIAGISITAAGGVINVASEVSKSHMFKQQYNKAQALVDEANGMYKELYETFVAVDQSVDWIQQFVLPSYESETVVIDRALEEIQKLKNLPQLIKNLRGLRTTPDLLHKTAKVASSVKIVSFTARGVCGAVEAVNLIFDVSDVIQNVAVLRTGGQTQLAKDIRDLVENMEFELQKIDAKKTDMRNILRSTYMENSNNKLTSFLYNDERKAGKYVADQAKGNACVNNYDWRQQTHGEARLLPLSPTLPAPSTAAELQGVVGKHHEAARQKETSSAQRLPLLLLIPVTTTTTAAASTSHSCNHHHHHYA
ncbi:hypothetical protein Pmani_033980 [Petrolisthes manimaculis]|uniref:Apolipoprotein L3 n=1 Tax=Petrolisthes manimaculis TaxID=1843537 RepID=A0AAE1NQH5_9EUCA|nr:hypothetical protein Pmani_033980 [Petrolisthes manimaculis]